MIDSKSLLLPLVLIGCMLSAPLGREDVWRNVHCDQVYIPDNCYMTNSTSMTVDDFERCGPARLELSVRNYFLAVAGRGTSYKDNKDAYDRIRMQPKMLRDVSKNSIETSVLGLKVDFPVGLSPVAFHKLVLPEGEKATVAAVSTMRTVMIVSSLASIPIEEVAAAATDNVHLWMQVYIFSNRSTTLGIVRRAESSGFKGVVLTCDSSVDATLTCNARRNIRFPPGVGSVNLGTKFSLDASLTFRDMTWLKGLTRLPIIAKGILSGEDAVRAVKAGASAILVSNHGGRQLDGVPATIDALPGVVNAVKRLNPLVEVYVDGGIRSGQDVFKAIAMGARMAFVGRPVIWGLAMEGSNGVKTVMTTLKKEFNETMLLAGVAKVSDIRRDTLLPPHGPKKDPLIPLEAGI